MAKHQLTNQEIPSTMNAIRLHVATGPAGLIYEQIETPQPGEGEVLVRVHAASITRGELDWPTNRLPAIPSYEFSGVISGVGPGGDNTAVGEEIFALSAFNRDGAAAEFAVVQRDFVAPKPKTLDFIQSASVPLAGLTAWQALFDHGQLAKGQRVLIHGATGGVGHYAVQLARLHGAYVIGTVSTRNLKAAHDLAIDQVIDHSTTPFENVVSNVDLVLDTVGGDFLERSFSVIRPGGRLVAVATEPSQERALARGVKAVYFVVEPNSKQLGELARLIDSGNLRTAISEVFALPNARDAFERSLAAHSVGKIVLRINEE